MAAPTTTSVHDLNGRWMLNKQKSDDLKQVLALQGLPWIIRKAASYGSVTLDIIHEEADGIAAISTTNLGTFGGKKETLKQDWEWHDHKDLVIGPLRYRSRLSTVENLSAPLPANARSEPLEDGRPNLIEIELIPTSGTFTTRIIWLIEQVDGQRHYVRYISVKREEQEANARLVYDWVNV